ncbi:MULTISPECIES: DUF1236 domain-containing protein [unclassified Mesorhizobium]|uniref:DUF1236 domain-containing protein n=1 Tax=unclassified Mesorhizobium TaxID=325217 RepID=UPI00095F8EC5|nr:MULTISPECIES: DUF1236 domain-containing protein [unclassified Mesorhizobium]MBN9255835.1 DUF1236 domain-containing protein [Mesorhizobium sp.]OJX71452.1 MAG: hypothetical protein BGO93_08515 [Mesorhizobium sp. 65-26]
MKTLLPIYAVCAIIAGASVANAGDTVVVQQPGAVVVEPGQQTVIKEYVHKNPVASINILGLELNLGSKVPDTVVLHEVPNVKYRYATIDNRTVLVDPETHEIVQVLN